MNPKNGISVSTGGARAAAHEAMDAETVAGLLGVSTRMLSNYMNHNGLPSSGSGRTRTFVWSEVREWFVGYRMELEMGGGNGGSDPGDFDAGTSESCPAGKEDIRAATLRKTKAEADLKQLALARQRAEVITIDDAKVKVDRMLGNLSAQLSGLPVKLADRLVSAKGRTAIETLLREEIDALRRELATGSIVDIPAGTTDDVDEDEDGLELTAADDNYDYGLPDDLTLPLVCCGCFRAIGPLVSLNDDQTGWLCNACEDTFRAAE